MMIHGPDIKLVGCIDDRGYALLEGRGSVWSYLGNVDGSAWGKKVLVEE